MREALWRAAAGVCLFLGISAANPLLDPAGRYERIICVVPLIGSGTVQDPKRPLFTVPADVLLENPSTRQFSGKGLAQVGIAAFQSVLTDDGQAAIVVFVAHRYSAFEPILKSSKLLRKFERKDSSEQDLIDQLRKYKHDFHIEMLRVGAL